MPVEVRWYDTEERVLCYEFMGHWTLEELHEAVDSS